MGEASASIHGAPRDRAFMLKSNAANGNVPAPMRTPITGWSSEPTVATTTHSLAPKQRRRRK
jgi:hypothetical protein